MMAEQQASSDSSGTGNRSEGNRLATSARTICTNCWFRHATYCRMNACTHLRVHVTGTRVVLLPCTCKFVIDSEKQCDVFVICRYRILPQQSNEKLVTIDTAECCRRLRYDAGRVGQA